MSACLPLAGLQAGAFQSRRESFIVPGVEAKRADRPLGFGILALLCTLVALLAVMVAGSKVLVGAVRGTLDDWQVPSLIMLAIALTYGCLALACRCRPAWLRWLAPLTLLVTTLLAYPELSKQGVLDLSVALVFLLAAGANLGAIAWARMHR